MKKVFLLSILFQLACCFYLQAQTYYSNGYNASPQNPAAFSATVDGCNVVFSTVFSDGIHSWDFGDGNTCCNGGSQTPVGGHNYASSGFYTITHNYNGAFGNQTDFITINVGSCINECEATISLSYCKGRKNRTSFGWYRTSDIGIYNIVPNNYISLSMTLNFTNSPSINANGGFTTFTEYSYSVLNEVCVTVEYADDCEYTECFSASSLGCIKSPNNGNTTIINENESKMEYKEISLVPNIIHQGQRTSIKNLDLEKTNYSIEIFNINGESISKYSTIEISTENLTRGIYFIRIFDDEQRTQVVKKLIIQ